MSSVAAARALVRTFPSALLGYSGGVDSACLAVILRQELGPDRMLAVIGRSASYPLAQLEAARDVASTFQIPLLEIATHELDDPHYTANPVNRCFFCKQELWARLSAEARQRGLATVCDGTLADDLAEHRPGHAAGLAAQVRSPFAEVGVGKAAVRAEARALGLPIWDAPASPCLSSRVAYGVAITPTRLRQIEAAEAYLRALGVSGNLRVRHDGVGARIEAEPRHVPWLTERIGEIAEQLRSLGFAVVELDPRGYRRGSLLVEARPGR